MCTVLESSRMLTDGSVGRIPIGQSHRETNDEKICRSSYGCNGKIHGLLLVEEQYNR
jgi:hypothetical protein